MALNLGGLSTYVDERSQELLMQAVIKSNTIDLVTIMPDVKYKSRLHYLGNDSIVIAAGGCSFSASGETTLTEKDVEVKSLKINETVCPEDLNTYWLQQSMRPGFNETLAFEPVYTQFKVEKVQEAIENMIWSRTAGSSVKCAGWTYLFDNDAEVNDYICNLTGATTAVASDWLAYVYALQNALPEAIQSATDLTLFVGYPIFRKMVQAFVVANLYHIDSTGNDGMSPFMFPGTNIKVVPVHGLDSLYVMVLTPASNLVYACDVASESSNFQLWWSKDDQNVKFAVRFKVGVQYYFGDYVAFAHI